MHSTCSDGKLSPSQVMQQAARAGLEAVALTDHDTTAGISEARTVAEDLNLIFIAGVEISSKVGSDEVHLLAYGFHPEHSEMQDFLQRQLKRRNSRGLEFVRRFQEAGLLQGDARLPDIGPSGAIARPHIAQMLVDAGTVASKNDAFEQYLSPGHQYFVDKPMPTGAEVINTVHSAGGVISLAHPGNRTSHQTVLTLILAGLDGIEVVHPSHDEVLKEYYQKLAHEKKLFCTGGSDFHADEEHGPSGLGNFWIDLNNDLLRKLQA